jgi:alpha-glucosidase (family GH31 glycosyl hydrolase)
MRQKWPLFLLLLIFRLNHPAFSTGLFSVTDSSGFFLLKTDVLKITIQKFPPNFTIFDHSNQLLLATNPANTWQFAADEKIYDLKSLTSDSNSVFFTAATEKNRSVEIRFSFRSASHFSVAARPLFQADSLQHELLIGPDEHFYGFGERLEGYLNADFDQRGTVVPMWRMGTQGVYVPFFMSTAGYGLFFQNREKGIFDLGKSDPNILKIRYQSSNLVYDFFYGPDFPKILDEFTATTGRPWIPPIWAFEPWKWRNEITGDWEIYEDAERLRHLDLPAGMTLIDRPHFTQVLDFRFNPVQFPDPQKLIDDLHRKGLRAILWAVPFVAGTVPQFAEGAANGYFLKYKNGKFFTANDLFPNRKSRPKHDIYFVDFSNPAAASWWKDQLKQMLRMGFDGFKLDRSDELLTASTEVIYFNGRSAYEMYNEYATLYAKTFWEACAEIRGNDFVVLSRPGFSGAQQYAIFFSGDTNPTWEHFRFNLYTLLRASLSGFPMWAQQLGGYRCKEQFGCAPTPECFIRWVQMGCFSPFFDRGGLWFEEPWDYAENTLNIFRYYAKLHSELVPYIFSLAQQAHQTGLPLVRPLVLTDPQNPDYWKLKDQYLFGDDFLVAPIIDSTSSTRQITLPAGRWRNYWDQSEILQGPLKITRSYPLSQLPLFVREGAIIPLRVKDDDTGHGAFFSEKALTIEIYPADSARFVWHTPEQAHVIEVVKTAENIQIRFSDSHEPVIFRVKLDESPAGVNFHHAPLPKKWQLMDLATQSGWFFDDAAQFLWIKIQAPGNIALTIRQDYQFADWKFEKSIFKLKSPVGIQVKISGKPALQNIRLVYQADFGPEMTLAPKKPSGTPQFALPLANNFEGRVRFHVQGLDAENHPVFSPIQSFVVNSDTSGPVFSNWFFPDSVWSDTELAIQVEVTDPSGVSRSDWAHGMFQIHWTVNDSTFRSFGEKLKDIFSNKNLDRHPRFKGDAFIFTIPPTHLKTSGPLEFYIEAWDSDKTPAKSRSTTHPVWVRARE